MVSVIILAAGNSSRMNGINKQLSEIGGMPVFIAAARAFEKCESVGEIIIAAPKENCKQFEELAKTYDIKKLSGIVYGGSSRFMSMKNALSKVDPRAELVAFHDGARPLITPEEIEKVIADAKEYGAAIAAVKAVDTVKVVSEGFIKATPPRSSLYYAQTPQVFGKELFLSCLEKIGERGESITDDSQILELCGENVRITEIFCCNMKITRQEDLIMAEAIFSAQNAKRK